MAEGTTREKKRGKRGAPASGKPTLRTIAEIAGLATTTISRALNNAPELSQETRTRVQKIAAEIGYLPDRAALRLKTGRTNVISLILDPHDEFLGFGQSLVSGINEALRGTLYHLVITPNFRDVPPIEPVRHIVRNRMADGIIFSRTEPDDERVKLLLEANFPFISHGRTDLGVHPYVDYDNDAFAYAAARNLIRKGRKRLLLIPADKRFTFAGHLESGFMRAVCEHHTAFEIPTEIHLDSSAVEIRDHLTRRMREPNPPDGFVCAGDASTLATMAALYDTGHSIGVDVDVFAKHASRIFGLVRPRVDATHEDIDLAGQQMAEMLIRRIGGEAPETLQVLQQPAV